MNFVKKPIGTKVHISPMNPNDALKYREWLNDREVAEFLALTCFRRVGFKEIGRRRQAHFRNGAFRVVVGMDLLVPEFGPTRIPALKTE